MAMARVVIGHIPEDQIELHRRDFDAMSESERQAAIERIPPESRNLFVLGSALGGGIRREPPRARNRAPQAASGPIGFDYPLPPATNLGTSPINPPNGAVHAALTAEELEACRVTGTTPEAFLERKQFEAKNPTTPFAVNTAAPAVQVAARPSVSNAPGALTGEELEVCRQLGQDPKAFLERKQFERANAATPFAVNAAGGATL
jgi:hypothetical protein